MKLGSSLLVVGALLTSSFSGQRVAVAVDLPRSAPIELPQRAAVAPPPAPLAWTEALSPLRVTNTKTGASCEIRLYAGDGSLDSTAAEAVDRVLVNGEGEARPLNRRLLQLLVKATTHFKVREIAVVSSWRDSGRKGSHHRSGEAIDFMVPGVSPLKVAAFLRGGSRVGVGVYTNRRTQFVHLDVREQSYHWADASPPGRVWRESRMTDRGAPARDAAYQPEQDLPEGR